MFHRQTNIVANTLVAIENLTTRIENGVAEAERRGLSFKKSCLEENLRGAMANRAAARALRSHWDVARDNPEYAERTVSRMLRLQVYAAVLEEDARGCKDVSTASQAVADKPQDLAPLTNIVSTPMLPSTDRPPLASPF